MSRIPDAEILYFDPSVTYLAPLKDKSARPALRAYRNEGVKPQENITVYALPPVLPFFAKFRWINRLNQKRIARYVTRRMKEHGFENATLWVYSPVTCDCVDRIPHAALIYDCVDRHSAYGGLMDPALVDGMEEELAARCDHVFATAEPLAQRLRSVNPNTTFLPNGANYERFARAAEDLPCPPELVDIGGPILGFVGALQPCIEYGFVSHAAKARPDWTFVFVGGEKPGADLLDLRELPNVRLLGMRKNEDLPDYLSRFDACLNLFASGDLSKDVSPLKFYEYLATGKPIVSTPQPDQILRYDSLIHIAGTKEAFVSACQAALDDTDPARKQARMDEGKQSSWDSRVAEMVRILRESGVWT